MPTSHSQSAQFINMYTPLTTIALLSCVCLSWAATPEYQAKIVASLAVCASEHKVPKEEVIEMVKAYKLPETPAQKCVAGCFFEKMDYLTDMTVDWAKVKAANPEKYDTPELVEKANQVGDACAKVVTEKASDICEVGAPAMKCILEEAKKIGLPKPDIKLE